MRTFKPVHKPIGSQCLRCQGQQIRRNPTTLPNLTACQSGCLRMKPSGGIAETFATKWGTCVVRLLGTSNTFIFPGKWHWNIESTRANMCCAWSQRVDRSAYHMHTCILHSCNASYMLYNSYGRYACCVRVYGSRRSRAARARPRVSGVGLVSTERNIVNDTKQIVHAYFETERLSISHFTWNMACADWGCVRIVVRAAFCSSEHCRPPA